MSAYSVKGKGWRYDFTMNGTRCTKGWFKTKKAAQQAEARRKEETRNPPPVPVETREVKPTDMAFLDLVNRRLDHVKAYCTEEHYKKYVQHAKRWAGRWKGMACSEVSQEMVQDYVLARGVVSAYAANKDLRYLRAALRFGIKKGFIGCDPTKGVEFLPVEKRIKYVPPIEDIEKVISLADPDMHDYLRVTEETLARVGEINRLRWEDVNLKDRHVVLYTRKKRGGHLTPRAVAMTDRVFEILSRRHSNRVADVPWVFDHTYRTVRKGKKKSGRFLDRREGLASLGWVRNNLAFSRPVFRPSSGRA